MKNVFAKIEFITRTDFSTKEKYPPQKRHAFVVINAEPNSCKSALEDLKKVEGVIEIYPSRGAYDIVTKVSGESLEYLREVIFKQIKNLASIKSILTLMVT